MSRKPDFEADREILLYLRDVEEGRTLEGNHPQAIWKALLPTKGLARSVVFNTINRLEDNGFIKSEHVPHEYKYGNRRDSSGTPMKRRKCFLTSTGKDQVNLLSRESEELQ